MKIHEYQAKELLKKYGILVPRGYVAESPQEAESHARALGGQVVVKAQVHSGGRGKAGGIVPVDSPEKAYAAAEGIIGKKLVTHQTGPEGKLVRRVLVEESLSIKKELYLSLLIDRSRFRECLTYLGSESGGMEIEEIVQTMPEKLIRVAVTPGIGYRAFYARKLMYGLALDKALQKGFAAIVEGLYNLFVGTSASLIEINPLGITEENTLVALDAKISLDDDGLYQHPELKSLRDSDEEDPLEVEAKDAGVAYIKLEGTIGCMVNGAGLAMATMDLVKLAGGAPANFLDVGGGASAEQVEKAFRVLTADKKVKAILVNIFGGILRCDRVATGLIEAAAKVDMKLPMVVRLQGTNVEEGRRLLQESNLQFDVAEELYEAAAKAVTLAG